MPVWKTIYLRHLLGEIGERCAERYVRGKGFWVERPSPRELYPIPLPGGDLIVAKEVAQDKMFKHFEILSKIVEVKTSYRKFPSLSGVLTRLQKKAKEETLFILVRLNDVSFEKGQVNYDILEIPEGWTDRWVKGKNKIQFKVESKRLICPWCGTRLKRGKGV